MPGAGQSNCKEMDKALLTMNPEKGSTAAQAIKQLSRIATRSLLDRAFSSGASHRTQARNFPTSFSINGRSVFRG
jgi:hypothetical protein